MSKLDLNAHHGEVQQENPVIEKQRETVSLVVMAKKVSITETEEGAGQQKPRASYMGIELFFATRITGRSTRSSCIENQRKTVSLVHSKKSFNNKQRTKCKGGNGNSAHRPPQESQQWDEFYLYAPKISLQKSMTPLYHSDTNVDVTKWQ